MKIQLIITSFLLLATMACRQEDVATLAVPKADFVTQNTAVVTFTITDEGTQSVLDQGICWSTNPNPTFEDWHVEDNMVRKENYQNGLVALMPNTTYYVRGYAKSGSGIGYSPEITIKTLPTMLLEDKRNGRNYSTVKIGKQVWMGENLDYVPNEGTSVYFNNDSQYAKYGRLYDWKTACKVCPSGWHLPSDLEWQQLEVVAGIASEKVNDIEGRDTPIGISLKEPGNLNWANGNKITQMVTNSLGFTIQPTGAFSPVETYDKNYFKQFAYFWTSDSHFTDKAYARRFRHLENYVGRVSFDKQLGLGVRCVKD